MDAIRALEDLKSLACALQAELAADLDVSVRAHHADLKLPTTQHGRGVAAQVALARRESPARGARFLGLAKTLTTELPHTLAALRTGALSEWRATLIARETTCLSREDRAVVDADLCRPARTAPTAFDGWGQRRLVAETQRRVYALDPAAVVDRRRRAETERHVSLRPAPDTMARLSALLPAAQGDRRVGHPDPGRRLPDRPGDPRTRGQVMADTLVARVTGQTTADAVPVAVNLVVSDQTLLGGGHHPAWLQATDPSHPTPHATRTTAAAITTALRACAGSTPPPPPDTLVAMDSPARCFPTRPGLFLDLRDQTCRTPWCDAPIRHHDHPTRPRQPVDPPPPSTAKASARPATTPNKPPAGQPDPSPPTRHQQPPHHSDHHPHRTHHPIPRPTTTRPRPRPDPPRVLLPRTHPDRCLSCIPVEVVRNSRNSLRFAPTGGSMTIRHDFLTLGPEHHESCRRPRCRRPVPLRSRRRHSGAGGR